MVGVSAKELCLSQAVLVLAAVTCRKLNTAAIVSDTSMYMSMYISSATKRYTACKISGQQLSKLANSPQAQARQSSHLGECTVAAFLPCPCQTGT